MNDHLERLYPYIERQTSSLNLMGNRLGNMEKPKYIMLYNGITFKGVSLEEFDNMRNQKVLKRGAFNKRIYLEREE